MELTPKADGTMAETRFHVDVDKALQEIDWLDPSENMEASQNILGDSDSDINSNADDQDPYVSLYGGKESFRRSVSMAELAASELVTEHQLGRSKANFS